MKTSIFTRDFVFPRTSEYSLILPTTKEVVCYAQDFFSDYGGKAYPCRLTIQPDRMKMTQSTYEEIFGKILARDERTFVNDGTPAKPIWRQTAQQSYDDNAEYLLTNFTNGQRFKLENMGTWTWWGPDLDGNRYTGSGLYHYIVAGRYLFGRLDVLEWWAEWQEGEEEPAPQFERFEEFDETGLLGFQQEYDSTVVCRQDLIWS